MAGKGFLLSSILLPGVAMTLALVVFSSSACRSEAGHTGDTRNKAPVEAPTEPPIPAANTLVWVRVAGEFGSYEAEVPSGWVIEDQRIPGGFARRYVLMVGEQRVVQFVARCAVGASVSDMIWQDGQIVSRLDGLFGTGNTRDVAVGGRNGKLVNYSLNIGGISAEYTTIYFESPPCGWRLVLQAFGKGIRDQFAPAFERFVASFVPLEFEPPFADRDPYVPR